MTHFQFTLHLSNVVSTLVISTSRQLYPRERAPVPMTKGAVWVQENVRTGAEKLVSKGVQKQKTQTVATCYGDYTVSVSNRPYF